MTNSRVNKYKELREGLRDEAGINREVTGNTMVEEEEDEFLSFVNRASALKTEPVKVEDTLVEAKTFEQIQKESSKEIADALKSVKSNMGKEEQYNTRMDILNKIRGPEKEPVNVDKVENVKTEQFAQGVFVKKEETAPMIEEPKQPKRRVTLMERLSAMSPKEDVERVERALRVEPEEVKETENLEMEETSSLEEMLKLIKKKDQQEVERIKQNTEPIQPIVVEKEKRETHKEKDNRVSRVEKEKEAKENKVVDVLNYIIVALIVVFIVLCVMIIKQIFF